MKWLLALPLALALAGCAENGNFDREKPIKLAAPTGHILSLTKSVPRKSFVARAEAANLKPMRVKAEITHCWKSAVPCLQVPMLASRRKTFQTEMVHVF